MCSPVTERNGPVALQGRSAGRRRPPWLAAGFPPSANSGSSRAAAALSAVVAAAGERLFCRGAPSASGRKAEAAHWAAVGSSFAGSAMPVASAQHKESAASTVSRYLLPKPPRHSPPLLPSPGPHHGFSPDPQACLQVSALSAVSAGAIGIRRLTRVICRMPAASRMRTPNPGPTVAVQGFPGSTRSPAGGTPRSDPTVLSLRLTRFLPTQSRRRVCWTARRHGCREGNNGKGRSLFGSCARPTALFWRVLECRGSPGAISDESSFYVVPLATAIAWTSLRDPRPAPSGLR
ncbi:hypothetical protein HPB51_021862 [Rhipicephalus microplus]|uniref:Uncharacterized protein n=1 Tax=Rhipicephalus microplus TaxID=6941 RepID=A0A9J6DCA6_RHIMP|nr:hypothetical protein HPB51_021862 [Rhipicephalus microplus]